MKLAKIIDNEVVLIDVEDGKEVNGSRTEKALYQDGYKKACPTPDGEGIWKEYPTCFVQEVEQINLENYE